MQDLNVSGNQLPALPDSSTRLVSLHCLLVSNNALETLPAGIGFMPALKQLCAAHNRLTEVPGSLQHASLVDLNLGYNMLSSVPEWLSSLTGV